MDGLPKAIEVVKVILKAVGLVVWLGIGLLVGVPLLLLPIWPVLKRVDGTTALTIGGFAIAGGMLWIWMKARQQASEEERMWWPKGCTSDCPHFHAEPAAEAGKCSAHCRSFKWTVLVPSIPPPLSLPPGPDGNLNREMLRILSHTIPPCLTREEIEELKRLTAQREAQAAGTTVTPQE